MSNQTRYTVCATQSRILGFSFQERTFSTMADALSAAKTIAHYIAQWFPGDGGLHFPRVVGPNGQEVPYTITLY